MFVECLLCFSRICNCFTHKNCRRRGETMKFWGFQLVLLKHFPCFISGLSATRSKEWWKEIVIFFNYCKARDTFSAVLNEKTMYGREAAALSNFINMLSRRWWQFQRHSATVVCFWASKKPPIAWHFLNGFNGIMKMCWWRAPDCPRSSSFCSPKTCQ